MLCNLLCWGCHHCMRPQPHASGTSFVREHAAAQCQVGRSLGSVCCRVVCNAELLPSCTTNPAAPVRTVKLTEWHFRGVLSDVIYPVFSGT